MAIDVSRRFALVSIATMHFGLQACQSRGPSTGAEPPSQRGATETTRFLLQRTQGRLSTSEGSMTIENLKTFIGEFPTMEECERALQAKEQEGGASYMCVYQHYSKPR